MDPKNQINQPQMDDDNLMKEFWGLRNLNTVKN